MPLSNGRLAWPARIVGLGGILALLLIVGLLDWHEGEEVATARLMVGRTHQVIDNTEQLRTQLDDAEAAQRSFLLTGDQSHLEPFAVAARDIAAQLGDLRKLTADEPSQQANFARIEQLVTTELAELRGTIQLRRDGKPAAALAEVETKRGKALMDALRQAIVAAEAEEQHLLAQRTAEADQKSRRSRLLVSAGALSALAAIIVALYMLREAERRRHSAEAKLEAKAAVLQTTMDNSAQGIVVFDHDGRAIEWNNRFVSLVAIAPPKRNATSIGDLVLQIDHRQGAPVDWLHRWALAASSGPVEAEGQLGARWLEVRSNPIPGGGFIATVLDITGRRNAEERFQRAQRLEAVGQLSGGIAHDFNNLLTVVSGNLELLARAVAKDAHAAKLVGAAQRAAARGARLTQQMLAFARRQILRPEPLDPVQLCAEFRPLLERAVGNGVTLALDGAPDLWRCNADPGQLEAALLNLAINARDAMPGESGTLTIEMRNLTIDREEGAGDFPEAKPGDYVAITVRDTGQGMTPEVLARVREPFYTTKEVGRGSGLGLSQVDGFVRQSGGSLRIESAPGQGTAVTMLLPRAAAAPVPAAAPGGGPPPSRPRLVADEGALVPAPAPAEAGAATILVVEDEEDVRDMVVAMLTERGYRVLTAHDGRAATALLQRDEPQIDLLFTDIVMPNGVSGLELGRAARRHRRSIKVLLTSGYGHQALVQQGIAGEFPLVEKPYQQAALADRIAAILKA